MLELLNEADQQYTDFFDSAAALGRAATDNTGRGQRLVAAIIEVGEQISQKGHKGVDRNEMADVWAKMAAENRTDAVVPSNLLEASLAHVAKATNEARTQGTTAWIANHVKQNRRYRPPKGGKLRADLKKERKALENRRCQLFHGRAVAGAYLVERLCRIPSNSRTTAFRQMRGPGPQAKTLWRACAWKHPRARPSEHSS